MSEGSPNRARVILFGSLGAAVSCAERLLERADISLVGVVCSDVEPSPWRAAVGDSNMRDEIARLEVAQIDLESLAALRPDLGISVRYDRILHRRHLDAFSLGVVNLHGAPLPEMRGSMCDAAALLEGRSEFGASLHWMDEGIDSGDILAVERFPIGKSDTVWDLFCRSNDAGLDLLDSSLADILSGRLEGVGQAYVARREKREIRTYRRAEVLTAREIPADAGEDHIWTVARAFSFPGHEPAWIATRSGRVRVSVDIRTARPGG